MIGPIIQLGSSCARVLCIEVLILTDSCPQFIHFMKTNCKHIPGVIRLMNNANYTSGTWLQSNLVTFLLME